ncbi:hypothetical protein F5J12DRAFT_310948 [Pisolithus orientalis]|uniref:uncharacterized protein n=1 Tax=Pisolithus orientalis TaxID=936130 RepID=UPI0022252ADD|nr:uncharacterized protein F5J12DRAFT_310948 [Pisolithus orientalis]KAI6030816.1 hypothetical protein F5J12DRAFT_310948 [Pisolithus orientalis]
MMTAPICKGILTLTASAIVQGVLPTPDKPLTKGRYEPSRSITGGLPFLGVPWKIISCLLGVIEAATVLAGSDLCPPSVRHWLVILLVHSHQPPSQAITQVGVLSPAFLFGTCLTIAGAMLRRHCYNVLGRFFTFELSIRDDHRLVTSGPYSIVRHPSYSACLLMQTGQMLFWLDRNSWLVTCSGLLPADEHAMTRVLWAARAFMLSVGYVWILRVNHEDAMLEKSFGKEWREWAKKVPYRLIPGVY